MKRAHETGFSTLEVIAAVAIVGIALVPIASLQIQIARGQVALSERQAEATAVRNSMALLRDVNPMQEPRGVRRLDDETTLTWTSVPISQLRQSVNPPGFEVQLYRVSAQIADESTANTFQLELIGWRAAAGGDEVTDVFTRPVE